MQKNIKIYCISVRFESVELFGFLNKRFKSVFVKDAAIVDLEEGVGLFFNYGVIVFWDVNFETQKYILDEIKRFSINIFEKPIVEDFFYTIDNTQPNTKITKDTFILNDDNYFIKLAISYALSQSTKLYYFEESVLTIIDRNNVIVNDLVERGKIRLSQKELSKERGRIFREISQIYLSYGFLDVPEFFWEYPELEPIYNSTANYLDIKPRIEVLNKKLSVLQDLLDMISDEQKHNHSSFLEVVIIVLIAIEILISIIKW